MALKLATDKEETQMFAACKAKCIILMHLIGWDIFEVLGNASLNKFMLYASVAGKIYPVYLYTARYHFSPAVPLEAIYLESVMIQTPRQSASCQSERSGLEMKRHECSIAMLEIAFTFPQ